ncbi:type II toxin-antitoxin system prevent-host-death family antitoxin [Sorangium sp. So ce131]|uniref:type II toxin-antitoxin system prevent-host-death family antitoxin n=1 Tax=Sorangium sp. So ce131 TaxID=3133282 RepID=UPI003F60FC5B
MAHLTGVQALKLHVVVDDAIVRALPALSPLRGQRIELIALGEAQPPIRVAPVAGGLLGQINMKDDFDAPLPDDIRRAFEGEEA